MMTDTKQIPAEVVGRHTHYVWIKILTGNDKGLRIALPRQSKKQTEDIENQLSLLSIGSVHVFELGEDSDNSTNLRVVSISPFDGVAPC